MTHQPWLRLLPWMGILPFALWITLLLREKRALENQLQPATNSTQTAPASKPPPLPIGGHRQDAARDAVDWSQVSTSALFALLRTEAVRGQDSGAARDHSEISRRLRSFLAHLSDDQLAFVVSGDPSFNFARQFDQISVSPDERLDAQIRWHSFQRLAAENPAAALRLTEGAPLQTTGGEMINLITSSLQKWTESDPVAAVRWGRTHADALPLGHHHAYMALEGLARHDMTAAWELARREGIEIQQAMAYLSRASSSPEACGAFMRELAALQAASDHGFVGGANQYYTEFAQRLGRGISFDAARAFVEQWGASIDWRDQFALAAAQTTFARTPNPLSESAADWAIRLTAPPRQTTAVENLVTAWAQEDFAQPAAWLQQHAQAAWHEAGLSALCRAIAPHDPAAAAEWAARIQDPELRARALPTSAGNQ